MQYPRRLSFKMANHLLVATTTTSQASFPNFQSSFGLHTTSNKSLTWLSLTMRLGKKEQGLPNCTYMQRLSMHEYLLVFLTLGMRAEVGLAQISDCHSSVENRLFIWYSYACTHINTFMKNFLLM